MPRIDTVQLELSLTPLYEGQALIAELYRHMLDQDYRMVAIDPAFENRQSGELLAVDGIFHRFASSTR
jgi:hypothetical protein